MTDHQKTMKIHTPATTLNAYNSPTTSPRSPSQSQRTLRKQMSQKSSCLCSPTTHAGSFRCRHHRNGSVLRRTGLSVGSGLSEFGNESVGSGLSNLGAKQSSNETSLGV